VPARSCTPPVALQSQGNVRAYNQSSVALIVPFLDFGARRKQGLQTRHVAAGLPSSAPCNCPYHNWHSHPHPPPTGPADKPPFLPGLRSKWLKHHHCFGNPHPRLRPTARPGNPHAQSPHYCLHVRHVTPRSVAGVWCAPASRRRPTCSTRPSATQGLQLFSRTAVEHATLVAQFQRDLPVRNVLYQP